MKTQSSSGVDKSNNLLGGKIKESACRPLFSWRLSFARSALRILHLATQIAEQIAQNGNCAEEYQRMVIEGHISQC